MSQEDQDISNIIDAANQAGMQASASLVESLNLADDQRAAVALISALVIDCVQTQYDRMCNAGYDLDLDVVPAAIAAALAGAQAVKHYLVTILGQQ